LFLGLSLITAAAAAAPVGWEQVDPKPAGGFKPAMAYDSAHGRTVLFGVGPTADATWLWDGASWLDVTSAPKPPGRNHSAMAYDSGRGRVVLFGGLGGGTHLADTWEWDGTRWSNVTPSVSPPARF